MDSTDKKHIVVKVQGWQKVNQEREGVVQQPVSQLRSLPITSVFIDGSWSPAELGWWMLLQ